MPKGPDGQPVRAEHVLIAGDSGSGKDTLGRWIADESEHPVITALDTSYPGRSVKTLDALNTQVEQGNNVTVYLDSADVTAAAMVQTALDHGPATVCFPEASNYLYEPDQDPAKQNNAVWWALTEGRDKGIKVLMTEQDPSDLPYTPLKQVPWIAWCGAPAGFSQGFFNHPIGKWMPKEELPNREHRYVVFHKSGVKVYPTSGTAETPESHA